MAYFELDEGQHVDNAHLIATVLMAGFVGVATWELWGRHMAPFMFGQELALAGVIQTALGIKGRLTAEALYFLTAIPVLPLSYLLLWRPFLRTLTSFENWFVDGFSFGIVLFT